MQKSTNVSKENANVNIPKKQRALVLQGGGALGAYEVGAIETLIESLRNKERKNDQVFDIVIGSSMGAINAAVLVSNVVNRKKTWSEAVQELEKFWIDKNYGMASTPDFSKWWWMNNDGDDNEKTNSLSASKEAIRKYYSVKEYVTHGTPRVCTPPFANEPDKKFGDQTGNLWFHHLSEPLKETIVKHSIDGESKDLRISTEWESKQPRLLVVAADVAKGRTETFDSYYKKNEDPKNLLYDGDGITIDQIMASATIPEFYDLKNIGGRQFCDGGWLSNTPFRELLQAHQSYWLKRIDKKDSGLKIPDLEVFIVNVFSPTGETIGDVDHDGVKDRTSDLLYFDRNSHYDENQFKVATDCHDIIKRIKSIALTHMDKSEADAFSDNLVNILKTKKSKSHDSNGKTRTYNDLLKGMFELISVTRIENNHDYKDSISGKFSDFTRKTIEQLIKKGKDDAQRILKSERT